MSYGVINIFNKQLLSLISIINNQYYIIDNIILLIQTNFSNNFVFVLARFALHPSKTSTPMALLYIVTKPYLPSQPELADIPSVLAESAGSSCLLKLRPDMGTELGSREPVPHFRSTMRRRLDHTSGIIGISQVLQGYLVSR